MKTKKTILWALFVLPFALLAQNAHITEHFGKISQEELEMKSYAKDRNADAVVLFESGDVKFFDRGTYAVMRKRVYRRIKILKKEGERFASVSIGIYNNDEGKKEKVKNLKAVTTSMKKGKLAVKKADVYTNRINDNWSEVSFAFPGAEIGSILEYEYDLETEFFFNLTGWAFQSDIPKVKSQFHAEIPGFWVYNKRLQGELPLNVNLAGLKSDCMTINGAVANCEVLTYAMHDVPALVEEESYSTSVKNYTSEIQFELSHVNYSDGTAKKYTKSWRDVDHSLKIDESVGRQLKEVSFFKKQLPPEVLKIKSDLERAKAVYYFIQDHFSLDEDKTYLFKDVRCRKAFESGMGGAMEVNLALINSLKAAKIEARIMLVSSRDNGKPTKVHPVMTDFNYLIAHVAIDDHVYLLDAANKFAPFNYISFEALNDVGRVLDFDKGSFWHSTAPKEQSMEQVQVRLQLEESGIVKGKLQTSFTGYPAMAKRKQIDRKGEEDYLIDKEAAYEPIEILNYVNHEKDDLEKTLSEEIDIIWENPDYGSPKIFFNPFIHKYTSNPFQLDQRHYPVNFGYQVHQVYKMELQIPESFQISSVPEDVKISLPNNGGQFLANFTVQGDKILVFSKIKLSYAVYNTKHYHSLKRMFKKIIETHQSLISLKKNVGP